MTDRTAARPWAARLARWISPAVMLVLCGMSLVAVLWGAVVVRRNESRNLRAVPDRSIAFRDMPP